MPCGYKLSPAAQGNLACRRRFREKGSRKSRVSEFFGKRSSEHQSKAANHTSGLRNLLRCDEAEGNPPRGRDFRSKGSVNSLASLPEGEQMLSCKEPGELFAICELGNGALCAPFPDRARALPREKVPRRGGRSCLILGAFLRGEQMLSCQSHGVALTICELGNGAWSVPFPDRARALPRETLSCRPMEHRRQD